MVYIILFCSHWNTFAAAAEEYGGERSRKACEGEVGGKWEKLRRNWEEGFGRSQAKLAILCNLERITMPAYCPCCLAIHCVNYTVILSHCRRLYLTPAPLLHMASQRPQIHSAETVSKFLLRLLTLIRFELPPVTLVE